MDAPLAREAELAARGDKQAFERLYRATAARVHSLARRIVGPQHCDDAVQQVYIRAWQKLAGFRGEAAVGTWLHRVALSVLLNHRARLERLAEREHSEVRADHAVTAREVSRDSTLDLEQALQHLPQGARDVFVLHDVEGHGHDEIAELLGVTAGTSRSQLHRARTLLREALRGKAEDER